MWTSLAADRFVQHFELDQVRDMALVPPVDVSSCCGANPHLWKTEFSFYPIRHFLCHLVQSTQLLQTLGFSFLHNVFHLLSAMTCCYHQRVKDLCIDVSAALCLALRKMAI